MTGAAWFTVEGPDGAGKATVAKALAHMLAHRPDPRPCVLHCLDYNSVQGEYSDWPTGWIQQGLHVVQDRGALSGPVYEPLFRRDMDRLGWLDPLVERAAKAGALLIHVTADAQTLEARVRERGDDYVNPELMQDILDGYVKALERWEAAGGRMVEFDTTGDRFRRRPKSAGPRPPSWRGVGSRWDGVKCPVCKQPFADCPRTVAQKESREADEKLRATIRFEVLLMRKRGEI